VAVNAPQAGTIKELLANEEDTVTVGQDLVRLEVGGSPGGGGKEAASSEAKEPAPSDQSTASDPKPEKREEPSPAPKEESKPSPPKQKATSPPKHPPAKKVEKSEPQQTSSSPLGSREERRVRNCTKLLIVVIADDVTGENESDALENRRTLEAISKHRSFPHHVQ
jgi:2-oxoglutarate dehydrogenase E2 component (dihydrolipoamide succinyltransferase)